MKPDDKKNLRIVDYGNGPHIYAGEVAGMMFDGGAVTLVLGNLEARIPKKNGKPTEPPVISVCGKLTLAPSAATEVVNMLTNLINQLNAISGEQPKHPRGPVIN